MACAQCPTRGVVETVGVVGNTSPRFTVWVVVRVRVSQRLVSQPHGVETVYSRRCPVFRLRIERLRCRSHLHCIEGGGGFVRR